MFISAVKAEYFNMGVCGAFWRQPQTATFSSHVDRDQRHIMIN